VESPVMLRRDTENILMSQGGGDFAIDSNEVAL
jgi:hypothetical protein